MRIAVDAMGGDHAPLAVVQGALAYAKNAPDDRLILVGDKARVEAMLAEQGGAPANIVLHHASQVVEFTDSATDALRKKTDSSIAVAAGLVRSGEADAFVSAGHTGAAVATSAFLFGTLAGVKRPGIAVPLPGEKSPCVLIDVGANIYCKPQHLFQYGVMASFYATSILKIENPRVGLLSIGEEEHKGNELTLATRELFAKSKLNFRGNAEGRDLWSGAFDVVVCEGFAGNALLKSAEGLGELCLRMVATEVGGAFAKAGAPEAVKPAIMKIKARMDYAQYGGAPLLGVNGVTIISHGRSDAFAMTNAIRVAAEFSRRGLNAAMAKELEANPC